jgi:hypothetical protein
MGLKRGSSNRPEPGAFDPASDAVWDHQVVRLERSPEPHLFEDGLDVGRVLSHEPLEAVRPYAMVVHPVAQERPDLHRHNRCLVGPLLRELALVIDEIVQERHRVGTESRKDYLIMGRRQHVDVVDL